MNENYDSLVCVDDSIFRSSARYLAQPIKAIINPVVNKPDLLSNTPSAILVIQ